MTQTSTMAHYRLGLLLLILAITAPILIAQDLFAHQNDLHSRPDTLPMPDDQMDTFSNILATDFTANTLTQFPDTPLQLVRPDHEHKKLVIVEENLQFLHSIKQPVSTVSVVGKFHSGKSFLMNQIMAKSNGFGIGSKVTPQTMGIWIWGKPVRIENPAGPSQWILLLDTEGFAANNVSENYDAKIFAVSTLLSSKLLYNSVKIIDQSDIDYLELLARRTQLFALKAQMTPQKDWTGGFSPQLLDFPSFIWVIQDFVQETNNINCREWLLQLLSSHARETESYEISLKDIFHSVDCHTMFIPSTRKIFLTDLSKATDDDLTKEYRDERDKLIKKIKSTIKPKTMNNRPFTGSELVLLLRILVNAANAGSLTNIPNRWDAFLVQLQKSAVEDCYKFYQAHLNSLVVDQAKNEPVNVKHLQLWHEKSQTKAFKLLSHLLQGLAKSLDKGIPDLEDLISKYFSSVHELNNQKIHLKLFNVQKSYELKAVDEFLTLNLPILSSELFQKAQDIDSTFSAQFTKEIGDLVDPSNLTSYLASLSKSIRLNLDSVRLRNIQKLEQFFDNVTNTLLEDAFTGVTINHVNPLLKETFESALRKAIDHSMAVYVKKSAPFAEEVAIVEAKSNKLKLALLDKANILRVDNENSVDAYLTKEMHQFLADFDRLSAAFRAHFPTDFEELKVMLTVEVNKFKSVFVEDHSKYKDYKVYNVVYEAYIEALVTACEKRQKENFEAYKVEVETPLKLAKKSIMLSAFKYSTEFAFKRFAITSCLLHLDDGKAKNWPNRLKQQIIESFLYEDEQLKYELESRNGYWSQFVGFFQWLLWLIFG